MTYIKPKIYAHIFYDNIKDANVTRIVINSHYCCPVNERIDGHVEPYLTVKEITNGKNTKWLNVQIKKLQKFHEAYKPINQKEQG